MTVLMALVWSTVWTWRVTVISASSSNSSSRSLSDSSEAMICKKDAAPQDWPTRNVRPWVKSKLSGTMKSFVPMPVLGMSPQEKRNGSRPPGWSWPWRASSRSQPLRTWDCTPSRLKLPMMSASTRSSRGRAAARLSAGAPNVIYLERTMPLLLRAICRFSISTYSPRMLSNSSWAIGILTL